MSLKPVYPMLAKTGKFSDLSARDDWVIQPKLDGIRCLVVHDSNGIRLYNRNLVDITKRFPDISLHIAARNTIIDGEIVCLDSEGNPNFQRVQTRANRLTDITAAALEVPAVFRAFDLAYLNNIYITDYTLATRLTYLGNMLPHGSILPSLSRESAILAESERLGEGIMLKKPGSFYRAGERTADWLKVKWLHETIVYISKLVPGIGKRADTFGAVEVRNAEGVIVGRVGTGFTDENLALLKSKGAGAAGMPIKVRFDHYTDDGQLRFPRFVGFVDEI